MCGVCASGVQLHLLSSRGQKIPLLAAHDTRTIATLLHSGRTCHVQFSALAGFAFQTAVFAGRRLAYNLMSRCILAHLYAFGKPYSFMYHTSTTKMLMHSFV